MVVVFSTTATRHDALDLGGVEAEQRRAGHESKLREIDPFRPAQGLGRGPAQNVDASGFDRGKPGLRCHRHELHRNVRTANFLLHGGGNVIAEIDRVADRLPGFAEEGHRRFGFPEAHLYDARIRNMLQGAG
jgi:hypothetical protein